MIVRTKVFEFCNNDYKNLSDLAQAMGISVSQIYRVRKGKRHINQKFIVGALKAFPDYTFDDLFYLTSELPVVSNCRPAVLTSIGESSDKGKKVAQGTQ